MNPGKTPHDISSRGKGEKYSTGIIVSMIIAAIICAFLFIAPTEVESSGIPNGTKTLFTLLMLPVTLFEFVIVVGVVYAVGVLFQKTVLKSIHIPVKVVRTMLAVFIMILLGILLYAATQY